MRAEQGLAARCDGSPGHRDLPLEAGKGLSHRPWDLLCWESLAWRVGRSSPILASGSQSDSAPRCPPWLSVRCCAGLVRRWAPGPRPAGQHARAQGQGPFLCCPFLFSHVPCSSFLVGSRKGTLVELEETGTSRNSSGRSSTLGPGVHSVQAGHKPGFPGCALPCSPPLGPGWGKLAAGLGCASAVLGGHGASVLQVVLSWASCSEPRSSGP